MCAGRVAGCADAVGVNVVFFGMSAEPTDGVFDVFDAGCDGCLIEHAIIDGDADVSFGGVVDGGLKESPCAFVTVTPAAAVDKDDGGARGVAVFFGHGQVEFPGFIAFAVGDVGDEFYAVG